MVHFARPDASAHGCIFDACCVALDQLRDAHDIARGDTALQNRLLVAITYLAALLDDPSVRKPR